MVIVIGNLTGILRKRGKGLESWFRRYCFGGKNMRGVFGANKKVWESLLKFVEERKVVPYIGKEFGWEVAKEAFELLLRRELVGKIVVRVKNDGKRGGF